RRHAAGSGARWFGDAAACKRRADAGALWFPCTGARIMKPELAILVGLQASGKTTFYQERLAATHVHVSKDRLRNNRNRERRQRELVEQHLAAGANVAVDNTNPTEEIRGTLIEIGRRHGAEIV